MSDEFLSALVVRNGDVLTHPLLDSHVDLVTHYKLPDKHPHIRRFVKVRLIPKNWMDVETWRFVVYEDDSPSWWTDELARTTHDTLKRKAAAMILRKGKHELILDGCWIVGGSAKVDDVRGGRIVAMLGGAISDVSGGVISNVRSGHISNVSGGKIWDVYDGTISEVYDGSIWDVHGGTIASVRSGSIFDVYGGTFSDVTGGTITGVWGGTFDASAERCIVRETDYRPPKQ